MGKVEVADFWDAWTHLFGETTNGRAVATVLKLAEDLRALRELHRRELRLLCGLLHEFNYAAAHLSARLMRRSGMAGKGEMLAAYHKDWQPLWNASFKVAELQRGHEIPLHPVDALRHACLALGWDLDEEAFERIRKHLDEEVSR